MPMHRWMASAASGTSQRLKPGPAMVRSFSSQPAMPFDAPCGSSTADMYVSLVLFERAL